MDFNAAKMSWSSIPLVEVESQYALTEHIMEDCISSSPLALTNISSPSLIVPMSRSLIPVLRIVSQQRCVRSFSRLVSGNRSWCVVAIIELESGFFVNRHRG